MAQSSPEDLRAAYQNATALWVYEGNLVWSKFNAMLVANSVVAAVIGFAVGSAAQEALPRAMCGLGLVLCGLWFVLTKRGFDNYAYWIFSARELEGYLGDQVVVVSRGGTFADGDEVTIPIETRSRDLRVSWISRQFTASWIAYLVILVFAAIYIVFLLMSVA